MGSKHAKNFFKNELYRIDKFLSIISRYQKNIDIFASNSPLNNDYKFLRYFDLINDDLSDPAFPTPISHAAKDVNRFYGLPKFSELASLKEWRGMVSKFETGLTRIAPGESFQSFQDSANDTGNTP